MNKTEELQAVIIQRDNLATFIFENDDGLVDNLYCLREMKSESCPYRKAPYGTERNAEICVPCVIRLIGDSQ